MNKDEVALSEKPEQPLSDERITEIMDEMRKEGLKKLIDTVPNLTIEGLVDLMSEESLKQISNSIWAHHFKKWAECPCFCMDCIAGLPVLVPDHFEFVTNIFRHELFDYTNKGFTWGRPKGTERYSERDLILQGMYGIYKRRITPTRDGGTDGENG